MPAQPMARRAETDGKEARIGGGVTIRALLFDADGVVVNGERSKAAFERDLGITSVMTESFFRGVFLDCLIGKADLKQCIAPYLPEWGWKAGVDEFLTFWFKVEHHVDQGLLDDIASYQVAGVACYLVTNQERYRTEYLMGVMGLGACFDGVFSSAYVGHMKDDPQFFEHVKRALHPIAPDQLLFWDDGTTNVETARRAGLQAEVYEGLTAFRQVMSRYIIGQSSV